MTTLALGLDTMTYLMFCGAVVTPILAPGPGMICVLARGFDGRGPGVRSALGIATGALFHTLLVTVGAATLFRTVPETAVVLKYTGVAYLGYLGVISLRNDEFDPPVETDAGASFRCDVPVSAFNPKVTLLSLAFLPGFAGQGAGTGVRTAGLDTTYAALTALYLSVIALGANRLGLKPAETWVASVLNYVGAGTVLLSGVVLALE